LELSWRKNLAKVTQWVPSCPPEPPKATIWSSTGPPKLQKPMKTTGKSMFYDVHKIALWTPSGRSFWPPGPPNGPPNGQKEGKGPPKGAKRVPKAPLWDSRFALFPFWGALTLHIGSTGLPRHPPEPQSEQKLVPRLQKTLPKPSAVLKTQHTAVQTERQKPQTPSMPTELPKRTKTSRRNKLSNPNAKNCKDPCTPTELPKRTKTSRCGGVASAFSINYK